MMQRSFGSLGLVLMAGASALVIACGGDKDGGGSGSPDGGAGPDAPPSNSISGTVNGYTGSAVDSDINDPDAPFAENDTAATAQAVTVPFTLGGYVNAPGAGPEGRSKAEGDVVDVFRVSLDADQLVLLSFDPDDPVGETDARNALQIYLLDVDGNPVVDRDEFPIEGRFQAETMRYFFVEEKGDYLIAVSALKGASSYVLLVDDYHGDGLSQQSAPHASNQVVARFRSGAVPASAARPGGSHRGLDYVAGAPSREMLLRYDPAAPERFLAQWGGSHLYVDHNRTPHSRRPVRGPLTPRTVAMLLEADASVEVAGANFIVEPSFVPNDTHYDVQWAFGAINAEEAWDTASGEGVIVAVIDTGVDTDHPDLAANLVAGYDFVRDAENAEDGDGIDPDPEQGNGGSSSHGTHVSGTIAAIANNDRGVAGLAWSAKVMPLRALGREGGTEYDVGQALRFAAGLDNDSGTLPDAPARVVNMSLGGPENSRWFQRVVYDAVRKGTVVVAAAGNDNSAEPTYPAWYDNVVSVASTDRNNGKSSFSNTGPAIDLAAPGSLIASTWGGGNYNYSSGTSMASPHAAAWVALMLGVNPALTPADIDAIIAGEDVFTDLGAPGRDDIFGNGLIDAKKAIDVAAEYTAGAPVVIPELALTPDQVILGPTQTRLTISGANIGDGTLSVSAATSNAPWVTVSGFAAADNSVELTVTVDRSTLTAPGVYETNVDLDSDSGPLRMPVLVVVRPYDTPSDLGTQVVSLMSGGSAVMTGPVTDGAYQLTSVPDGSYRVVVSTDLDNDGSTCGRGEACGANGGLEGEETASPVATGVDVITDWLFQ
jgi:serine protease